MMLIQRNDQDTDLSVKVTATHLRKTDTSVGAIKCARGPRKEVCKDAGRVLKMRWSTLHLKGPRNVTEKITQELSVRRANVHRCGEKAFQEQ